jgi:hypothetical protein
MTFNEYASYTGIPIDELEPHRQLPNHTAA